MIIGAFFIGLALGAIILFLYGKTTQKQSVDAALYTNLEKEVAVLQEKNRSQELAAQNILQEMKVQLQDLKNELAIERKAAAEANEALTKSRSFFSAQQERLKEQRDEIDNLQVQLKKEFELIAGKILEEKSVRFTEQNKTNIDGILNPLKERIKEFEEKVDKSYRVEAAERNTLKGSIDELMKLNTRISEEANNLTQALKGDNKTQGNWGEQVLEKILEVSGLIEGTNYTVQGKGLNLQDENGNRQQPDVIIQLPDEKHIIIDAKVSLIAYEKLVRAESEESRERFAKEHLNSIKAHIAGLSAKNYQDLYGIHSPDFVILFIPIESMFSVALQHDRELFDFAWSKRIVLVTPSTLLATLKTVASVWKQEQQTRNALEIARKAGALYDKFVGFLEDLNKIGEQLSRTQKTYDEAYGKLQTGRGSLVSSVENLRKLGARANKQIDRKLLDENEADEE